jgi:hypothetical protein
MFEDTLNSDLLNDGWLLIAFYFLWQSFEFLFDGTRNPPTEKQRVDWEEHRDNLIERGHFHWSYRMSPTSFDTLVGILGNTLVLVNETRSYARSEAGPIIPEIRLHCLMRYLAGGSYLDICTLVSIPHSTFYILLSFSLGVFFLRGATPKIHVRKILRNSIH